WLDYADPAVAPIRRSSSGPIAAIIRWLDYADPGMARICRSVTPTDCEGVRGRFGEVANGRLWELRFAKTGSSWLTGLEKVIWPKWVYLGQARLQSSIQATAPDKPSKGNVR
ncbi:hypothetical protein, partial [Paraburkholderia sp. BR14320]|uniref:hypothetical protein n=1 Tax=unclassified Paraburkholderia TaxID=2615204 RepID=UPI0034CE4A97